MKNKLFADNVRRGLEVDIENCLRETKHINGETVKLDKQYISICTDNICYKGTFEVSNGKRIRLGDFVAKANHFVFSHNIFNGRPMYNLTINYCGDKIYTKFNLFYSKYIVEPEV